MNAENKNALLEHIKNVPEWQSALIYEQLAAMNKAAADISTGTSTLEQGFADGKLRPDRYYCSDRVFRRDCNTGVLDSIASALGRALAALEVLSALSDAFQRSTSPASKSRRASTTTSWKSSASGMGTRRRTTHERHSDRTGQGPVVTTLPDTLQGIEAWLGGHADQKYFSRTPAILMHSAAGREPNRIWRGEVLCGTLLCYGWRGGRLQPLNKALQAELLDRLKDTEVRV